MDQSFGWFLTPNPEQLNILDEMVKTHGVQPPDLFVYTADRRFWFAEAKGPGDRLSAKQTQSHRFIEEHFQVQVEVFQVRVMSLDP